MLTDPAYELLRQLASPVVAVTSSLGGAGNGMILDSAVRASISPRVPRLSVYIHKWHLTHDYVWKTGRYGLHLLHRQQFDLIYRLGFFSGRDRNKLDEIDHRHGASGVPVLHDCYAAFECRVVNAMDAGASTFFLADVTATHAGSDGDLMTAEYFRTNLPEQWRDDFARNYREAQERIASMAQIQAINWPGPTDKP
jgi:flavin reductase (DIM6/NTAB) family NADH-FMN oxidoreductase RutF